MATTTTTETEYHVIKVCRSDGCDTGPGYWPVEAPKAAKKATKDAPEKVTRTKPPDGAASRGRPAIHRVEGEARHPTKAGDLPLSKR